MNRVGPRLKKKIKAQAVRKVISVKKNPKKAELLKKLIAKYKK
ncbi:MAG: hypothetical protein WCF78_03520 [archaeon]